MLRGFYTAASGVYTQEKMLNSVANNIANVNTAGYKRENLVMGTFGEHLTVRMNAYQRTGYEAVGPGVYMQIVDDKYTDFTQGSFDFTTRPLDMCIAGDGYFVIANEAGEEFLSRDGQFSLDEEGFLVLPGFGRVQGQEGDIQLGVSDILVDREGGIYIENEDGEAEQVNRLQIAFPDDYTTVEKVTNSLFTAGGYTLYDPDAEGDLRPSVRQFVIERSNVNMSDEMTRMINSQRQLQSCSQIVKMYDEMAQEGNSRVARRN